MIAIVNSIADNLRSWSISQRAVLQPEPTIKITNNIILHIALQTTVPGVSFLDGNSFRPTESLRAPTRLSDGIRQSRR